MTMRNGNGNGNGKSMFSGRAVAVIASVASTAAFLFGVMFTTYSKGEEITTRVADVRQEINSFKNEVATDYVRKDELKEVKNEILTAIEKMEKRFNARLVDIKSDVNGIRN